MNFITNTCWARFGRAASCSPWCRVAAAEVPSSSDSGELKKYLRDQSIILESMLNKTKLSLLPGPTHWTQVRFKDFPRFHRDIEPPSFDNYRKTKFKDVRKTTWGMGDEKVGVTYLIAFLGALGAMYGTKSEVTHFLSSMSVAADVLALATIEVDLSKIEPGSCVSIKWRGKPLFVKHRTPAEIAAEENTPLSDLRDPETPDQRVNGNQEWLIIIGICTHLGCVPIPNSGDWMGGFYCPCHGSHYDNLARIRKGPAPTNMEKPPYKFVDDELVLVG